MESSEKHVRLGQRMRWVVVAVAVAALRRGKTDQLKQRRMTRMAVMYQMGEHAVLGLKGWFGDRRLSTGTRRLRGLLGMLA